MGKFTAILEGEKIFTIEDLLNDIKQYNRLYQLYDAGVIDYALYRGLNLISSYNGYKTDLTADSDEKYSHGELYKHLKNNVLLWFQRSNCILRYNILKKIVQYIRLVTNNENKRGNSLKQYYANKYNYQPRQRLENYNKAVMS